MSDQLKWYVVRAISGKEKKVKQYVDAEINRLGISHLVPQVLIPTEKYYQMREGKKIAKERNFFPGYVLVHMEMDLLQFGPTMVMEFLSITRWAFASPTSR